MRISYTPEQEELRRELRSYFTNLMTPERREALTSSGAARSAPGRRIATPSRRWAKTGGSP